MYYSLFVSKVEEYKTPKVTAEQAVLKAVNYCIEHDIMKEFLEQHRQEVVNMFTEEWNIEEAKGRVDLLVSLVKDRLISITEAAKRANMTESAFSSLVH